MNILKNSHGANLVEYIIIVGVIVLIALAGFKIFGRNVREKIDNQATTVKSIGN